MKNKSRWTMSRQLELLVRNEPEMSLPESNKQELIDALAELVVDHARYQYGEEEKRYEGQDNR